MMFAHSLTGTPPTVAAEHVAARLVQLREPATFEPTRPFALANLYAGLNVAKGIEPRGLKSLPQLDTGMPDLPCRSIAARPFVRLVDVTTTTQSAS